MSESKCSCDVGPGRYEGESATTVVVHGWDVSNEYLSYGDGSWADLLPEDAHTPWEAEDKARARGEGFCDQCIVEAEADFLAAKAITYGSSSTGFLWSALWDDADAARKAYDEDAADLAEAEAEADQEA